MANSKSTLARTITRAVGAYDEFNDHGYIATIKVNMAKTLAAAAKKGEYKDINLSDDEDDALKVLRQRFKTLINDKEECDAIFPRAALFAARVDELRNAQHIDALKPESINKVLADVRSELARMFELTPLRDGESVADRRQAALKVALGKLRVDMTDPQGHLAMGVWSKVDLGSPAAAKQAERLLLRASDAVEDAFKREELQLLTWALATCDERRQANAQQADVARRRAALNPGLRKAGFFERIGQAIARGAGSEMAGEPRSWKPKKNGFREVVAEAEASPAE